MAPTKLEEPFQGNRLTFTSKVPFDTVLKRLGKELLDRPEDTHNNPSFLFARETPDAPVNAEIFKSRVESAVGPAGLMQFYLFNHGDMLRMHGLNEGRGLRRILVGNPLIAMSLMSRDVRAGISAPVDVLVKENEDKSTSIIFHSPLAMMAGINKDDELVERAASLTSRLENVVLQVLDEDSLDAKI